MDWEGAVPQSPPSLPPPAHVPPGLSASWGRIVGRMGLAGPSTRDVSLRIPTLPRRVGTEAVARQARRALDPGHNLAHAPNTPCCSRSLRLCAQQPRRSLLACPFPRAASPGGV